MFNLKKLIPRTTGSSGAQVDPDSGFQPTASHRDDLELEYAALIAIQLRRFGISRTCVSLEVTRGREASDGRSVFVGMIHVVEWDRVSALRVMLGLPIIETKVRQAASGTWLADVSHFGGLWLNATGGLRGTTGPAELHELIVRHAPARRAAELPPQFSQPVAGTCSV